MSPTRKAAPRWIAVALGLAGGSLSLSWLADSPQPGLVGAAEPNAPATVADWQLESAAYDRLRADPQFKAARVGVTVRGGKAELWGVTGTAADVARASALVAETPGLAGVDGKRLKLLGAPDLLDKAVVAALKDASEGRVLPDKHERDDTRVAKPPVELPAEGIVFPPAETPTRSVVADPPRLPKMDVAVAPRPPVVTARPVGDGFRLFADGIRDSESRFAGLSVDLVNGEAVVTGTAPRAKDAWDFAAKVERHGDVKRTEVRVR